MTEQYDSTVKADDADLDVSGDEMPDEDEAEESPLEEAKERFKISQEAERENRELAADDDRFFAGQQWEDDIKNARKDDGRPCLVINRLPQFVRQVSNDQRQNRPSIKVSPVDDKTDPETAKIIQGGIRHIEYASSADAAYDTAFEQAVKGGWGYWRIITDFVDPESFDQDILIKRIPDRFSVTFDPYSTEPDGSDANFAFVSERISKDEFKERYPDAELSTPDGWQMAETRDPFWMGSDGALVVEYFYRTWKDKTIVLLSSGDSVEKSEVNAKLAELASQGFEATVLKERKTRIPSIKWCKFNASEVLAETDWPGKWIPIVPVYGSEQIIDGERFLEGIVRNAKDPQRMLNFWKSAETEAIALAPRAPFIAAEGQLEGYAADWNSANRKNHSVLTYKPIALNGQPMPPPQRNAIEPAVQAITQASMQSADDMKAVTGIYDAALGARSNETSGVAIQKRNQQAQTSVYHFVDNLTRSIKHTGRILIDLMPHIYDTARAMRIIGDDGSEQMVRVNDPGFKDPKTGQPILYDLSAGKYDVTVDVGPSYATRRQEAAATIQELARSNPQLMQVAGDLLMSNLDFHNSKEIAERLKKMLPPQLQEQQQGQVPPQAQQQMQQSQEMIKSLTEQVHKLQDEKEQKLIELESRERIEMAKLETTATIELAKLQSKEALGLLQHQINELDARQQMIGMGQPFPDMDEQEGQMSTQPQGAPQPQQENAPEMPGQPPGQLGGQNPTGGESPGQPVEPQGPMQ